MVSNLQQSAKSLSSLLLSYPSLFSSNDQTFYRLNNIFFSILVDKIPSTLKYAKHNKVQNFEKKTAPIVLIQVHRHLQIPATQSISQSIEKPIRTSLLKPFFTFSNNALFKKSWRGSTK